MNEQGVMTGPRLASALGSALSGSWRIKGPHEAAGPLLQWVCRVAPCIADGMQEAVHNCQRSGQERASGHHWEAGEPLLSQVRATPT